MTTIIVTTPEELERLISKAVANAMQQFESRTPKQVEKKAPIGAREAAKILGMAYNTLRGNVAKIPHYKRHGKLYFFENELLAYIKAGKVI